jgi:UDP:flavonoid glycosyltransferase YjiC (YdhE family)
MVCDYVPLPEVLPLASLLIHHGGIGTLSAAVQSSCPQLILAGRFDQPDNAVRVARLGLGGSILRTEPSVQLIAEAAGRIISSKFVAEQIRMAASQARKVDGIATLAALVGAL